jgi:radical SAM superfamily enzyme YgiQ (UPF0313 family)
MDRDLLSVSPFEVCSIRPPTENFSLTFRLTRNCYWNRCAFCPAYKFGARFSKRTIEEIREDIGRAKRIDDLMLEQGVGSDFYSGAAFGRVQELVGRIERAKNDAGQIQDSCAHETTPRLDPELAWFLQWFKDKPTLEDSLNHVLSWRMGGARTCFMGDADSLILKPDFVAEVIEEIRLNFPEIQRFTVYGRTKTAARLRNVDDLKAYAEAGLDRVHFGLESGSDRVLKSVHKGVTREEHIEGGLKTKEAGLSCSVYVMPGLGGARWPEEHARETADVLTRIAPDYVRLRSLQVFPQTPLDEARRNGEFIEGSEEQVVREIRILVEETNAETEIISDSASNLLHINGRLPDDRAAMLDEIDQYLALSPRDKLLFSLESRVNSFVGQYGGLTRDISQALGSYRKGDRLEFAGASDDEIRGIVKRIRSKLMP